ncbi:MAG: hypothetical protein PHU88_07075 [candidate division Zixibacteria bacterium]|nr:hypothetical protein [candidate division Zixibacteria bacterium]MDD5426176.1 hypothetical protein [candidate division Zixibacteria bacterium]
MNPPSEYNPGTTIGLLHRSKRDYQYNMLKSLAITMIIPAVTGFLLLLFPGNTSKVKIDLRDVTVVTIPETTPEGVVFSKIKSAGHSGINNDNFIGSFKGYTIVKDRVSLNIHVPDFSVRTAKIGIETFDFSKVENERDEVYGGDIDWIIPGNSGNNIALIKQAGSYEQANWKTPVPNERFNLTSSIDIDEWATVKIDRYHRRPVHPKKSFGKRGVAQIGVYIDAGGNIVRMEILDERPTGHDFAKALKEWVSDWCCFFPPRINGVKVGTYIIFEHFFGGSNKESIKVTGPLIVHDPDK